jgi:hypothetical protein
MERTRPCVWGSAERDVMASEEDLQSGLGRSGAYLWGTGFVSRGS